MYRYTPGNCDHITDHQQCLRATIGVKCVWNRDKRKCEKIQQVINRNDDQGRYMGCLDEEKQRGPSSPEELCKLFTDCVACVQTSYNCVWCGKGCAHVGKCRDNLNSPASKIVTNLQQCDPHTGIECLQLHTCHACSSNSHCIWSWSNGPDRCKPQGHTKTREVCARAYVCMCKKTNGYNSFYRF